MSSWRLSAASSLLLAAAFLIASCGGASRRPPEPSEAVPDARVRALLVERSGAPSRRNYEIAPGDVVSISVREVKEMSGRYLVDERGMLTLPVAGTVGVQGSNEHAAAGAIGQAIRRFVRDPHVTLAIEEYEGRKVTVMGSVANPGAYSLRGFDQSIGDVISMAGGVTHRAGSTIHFVPAHDRRGRARPASDRTIAIDLSALDRGVRVQELAIPVRSGDWIFIPDAGEVFVEGWVQSPGAYPLVRGLQLSQAIANAGGLHFGAARTWIELARIDERGHAQTFDLNLDRILSGTESDLRLLTGDRIRVRAQPAKAVAWAIAAFLRRVVGFGVGGSYNVTQGQGS